MVNSLRFGSALSAIALVSVIAGCATPQGGRASANSKANSNVGVATRALAAMQASDFATAVVFAEQAVENSPGNAAFRALLGNAYFGSGRFASAETAYRDSLSLAAHQPQVVLKLALVQIAQGQHAEALSSLYQSGSMLDAADYGLALALAGQPQQAVQVLEPAARQVNADARLRQNLALAYALSGDWTAARVVAAQDLAADQIDARIQHWMVFAKPARASDQVAALTGVTPVAGDPGQPTRLALHAAPTQTAEAAPAAALPQPVAAIVAQPLPAVAQVEPQFDKLAAAPAPAPAQQSAPQPAPAFTAAVEPEPAYVEPKRVRERPAKLSASYTAKLPRARPASLARRSGKSTAVVQLGAYGSPQRVAAAWNSASRRYSVLRGYAPVSARFNSSKGLVYRLSVKGFGSPDEAKNLCMAVRRSGGSCFVRHVAGDTPVRLASR